MKPTTRDLIVLGFIVAVVLSMFRSVRELVFVPDTNIYEDDEMVGY